IYYDSLYIDSITQENLTWNKYHNILTINKKLSRSLLEEIKATNDSIALSLANAATDTLNDSTTIAAAIEPTQEEATDEEEQSAQSDNPRAHLRQRGKDKETEAAKPKNKFAKS